MTRNIRRIVAGIILTLAVSVIAVVIERRLLKAIKQREARLSGQRGAHTSAA